MFLVFLNEMLYFLNSVLCFCLVNWVCCTYTSWSQALYSHSKLLLLFFSLLFFDSCLDFFLFFALGSNWLWNFNSAINFPQLFKLFFPFWLAITVSPYHKDIILASCVFAHENLRHHFLLYVFILFPSLAQHTKQCNFEP